MKYERTEHGFRVTVGADSMTLAISPEDVAAMFAGLCSDDQARFFNHVAEIASPWLAFQLQSVTDEDGLTLAGRRVMQEIGEYSHWGLVPRARDFEKDAR